MIEQIKILVMNRFFTMLGAIALLFVSSCSKYDDSNLWDSVHALEERMIQLEQLCKQMNTNISSLQTIVTAVQTFDYVTGVTPIIQDGQEIGYTISFTKSNPITIYHGKDGEKGEAGATGNNGDTPVIGVRQDTDGIYYWTLNGNWLTDGAIYDGMNDLQVNSGSSSVLTLSTPKYYPSDASKKLYFYAWSPAASSITAGGSGSAPVANYTLTGQEDILWAKDDRGIAKDVPSQSSQPSLNFTHKLKQVKFKLVKDASFEEGQTVSSIKITQVKTSAKLNLSDGTLTFDGQADQELDYPIDTGTDDAITAEGTEMHSCVMFEPGATFTISITVGGVEYRDVTVSLGDGGVAGNSYLVTLTFKRNDIVPTASITDWVPGTEAGVDIM